MDLGSYLTFGWGANPEGRYSAARIHREAINSEMEYNQALSQSIMELESNNFHITGLEPQLSLNFYENLGKNLIPAVLR